MGFEVARWAQEQNLRDPGAKATLLVLANHADKDDYTCFPGQKRLARYTEQSERQVRRQIQYLQLLGVISVERKKVQGVNKTTLHVNVGVDIARDDPRRCVLRGDPYHPEAASADQSEASTDSVDRTVATQEGTPTGLGTVSSNCQKTENSQRGTGDQGRPGGIVSGREALRLRMAAALEHTFTSRQIAPWPEMERKIFNTHMGRLIAAGVPRSDLEQRIDVFAAFTTWWTAGTSPWWTFLNPDVQQRLAVHVDEESWRTAPVAEPYPRPDPALPQQERFEQIRSAADPRGYAGRNASAS